MHYTSSRNIKKDPYKAKHLISFTSRESRDPRETEYREERRERLRDGDMTRQYDERAGPSNRETANHRDYRPREFTRTSDVAPEAIRDGQQGYALETQPTDDTRYVKNN